MSTNIRFDDRVAIVTGAGGGLGRSHALGLAARGAKVVVNDLGAATDGTGASSAAADAVVREIQDAGGIAMANGANVADFAAVEAMVKAAVEAWGRVDILVNNAGILRDKSFAKMSLEDFRLVMDVHLMGSVHCTKAVWPIMQQQQYGRIVMTSSSSGLYGNFGQTNYAAAKMAVVGLMNTLVLEGQKYDIRVNTLAPGADTRMTEGLIPEHILKLMTPEAVTAGLLALVHENAPNRTILCATAGGYSCSHLYETPGIYLAPESQSVEQVVADWPAIDDREGQTELMSGGQQVEKYVSMALKQAGATDRK